MHAKTYADMLADRVALGDARVAKLPKWAREYIDAAVRAVDILRAQRDEATAALARDLPPQRNQLDLGVDGNVPHFPDGAQVTLGFDGGAKVLVSRDWGTGNLQLIAFGEGVVDLAVSPVAANCIRVSVAPASDWAAR